MIAIELPDEAATAALAARVARLVRQGDAIMMKRSNAFFTVILALAAIRFLARSYLDTVISAQQTGALFFVLAFGMILRWRAQMLMEYRKLAGADDGISRA